MPARSAGPSPLTQMAKCQKGSQVLPTARCPLPTLPRQANPVPTVQGYHCYLPGTVRKRDKSPAARPNCWPVTAFLLATTIECKTRASSGGSFQLTSWCPLSARLEPAASPDRLFRSGTPCTLHVHSPTILMASVHLSENCRFNHGNRFSAGRYFMADG